MTIIKQAHDIYLNYFYFLFDEDGKWCIIMACRVVVFIIILFIVYNSLSWIEFNIMLQLL